MDIQAKEKLINQYLQHCRYAKGLNERTIKASKLHSGGNLYEL